jgi:hypothetical protein
VAVYAIATLQTNPRLAIAGAASVSNLGLAVTIINHDASVPAFLSLAVAPVVLAGAIIRIRRLRQPTPI